LRIFDDIFHRLINSLERYERFLLQSTKATASTAIGDSRDHYNDIAMPSDERGLLLDIQIQLTCLNGFDFQEDKQFFSETILFYLNDLLGWYGGRPMSIRFDKVDAFALPIVLALTKQVKSKSDLKKITENYVAKLVVFSDYSQNEQEKAIGRAMGAIIKATDEIKEKESKANAEHIVYTPTSHIRDTASKGFKRIISAMTSLYNESIPAIRVYRTIKEYLPNILKTTPEITEEYIKQIKNK
jgi:hypothetical protein